MKLIASLMIVLALVAGYPAIAQQMSEPPTPTPTPVAAPPLASMPVLEEPAPIVQPPAAIVVPQPATHDATVCANDTTGWQGTQSDLNRCADLEFRKYDADMNTLYEQKLATLHAPDSISALQNSQAAWVIFRNKTCDYEPGPYDDKSSLWVMGNKSCKTRLTHARVEDLRSYLECTQPGCPN